MRDIQFLQKMPKKDFEGKRVLLRLDLNVVVDVDGNILDDFRIKKVMPTIRFLSDAGARTMILSHIGRSAEDSLRPVFEYFEQQNMSLSFYPNVSEVSVMMAVENMQNGSTVLFENLRQDDGEEKNDNTFARRFAQYADIYVNDAFSASHRAHASIVSLPQLLPSYAGVLFEEELAHLSEALNPPRPFLFILGGAKFKTKLPLIEKYLSRADDCFIGGALANNFFKSLGLEIGESLIDDTVGEVSKLLLAKNLLLPVDVWVKNKNSIEVKKPDAVAQGDMILDAGPETLALLSKKIDGAKFVLWNGPLGDYKIKGFEKGTEALVNMLAERGFKDGELIIGGGDTSAVISRMGLVKKFPFISTAGGAMLEFLTDGTLPGIEALKNNINI